MKVSIPISIVALIISVVSLIHSYTTPDSVDQEQAQRAVDEALRVREKEFVDEVTPRFQIMFAEMGDEFNKGWNPETIEELIEPLTRIINDVSSE